MRKLTALLLALLICLPLSGLAEEQKDLTTVRMTLVGDCILGSDEPLHSEKDSLVGMIRAMGNDYAYPFKYAKDFFEQDDYTLINLECVLTDKKSYKNASLYTNFRGPADFVNMLTQNSIEGVSLSNNHALDYGQGGLKDCQKNLTEAGIQWAYNTDTFTFERNGVKFAVLSFRRYYMEMYYQWIEKEIPRMKAEDGVDFVIVCLHHGEEYQDKHNDKDQTRFARHAIDSGLALIPEDRRREGLVLMHSVEENLIVPIFDKLKRGLLLEDKKVADIAERSISDMAIKTHSRKTPAFNLSGGNQQKIVVGKWLNSAPSVLLLDEPTAGVDVGSKREIIDKVRDFVGENRAAIFISSDILELISACDRFIVFYDGKVTATYDRSEITEEVLQYAIQNEC